MIFVNISSGPDGTKQFWTNVDSSPASYAIHLELTVQEMLMKLITTPYLKITHIK